jgi:hypothetical protein
MTNNTANGTKGLEFGIEGVRGKTVISCLCNRIVCYFCTVTVTSKFVGFEEIQVDKFKYLCPHLSLRFIWCYLSLRFKKSGTWQIRLHRTVFMFILRNDFFTLRSVEIRLGRRRAKLSGSFLQWLTCKHEGI